MQLTTSFWLSLLERFIACALLFILFFTLLLIALLIYLSADSPVTVTDEMRTSNGTSLNRFCRFRTTGRRSAFFHTIGRFLRSYSIDELPGLWSVALGDIKLKDFFRLI